MWYFSGFSMSLSSIRFRLASSKCQILLWHINPNRSLMLFKVFFITPWQLADRLRLVILSVQIDNLSLCILRKPHIKCQPEIFLDAKIPVIYFYWPQRICTQYQFPLFLVESDCIKAIFDKYSTKQFPYLLENTWLTAWCYLGSGLQICVCQREIWGSTHITWEECYSKGLNWKILHLIRCR